MSSQSSFTNLDSFWQDDFKPLEDAGKTVLAALRDDEKAPDADLYRRIGASGPGSHRYFSESEPMPARTAANGTSITNNNNATTPLSTPTGAATQTAVPSQFPASKIPPPTITMKHERSVPLPHYISQQMKEVKGNSLMGLLPEAEMAWLSVDNKLFIWPYAAHDSRGEGPRFCTFTVPTGQYILSVGVVHPKRVVFNERVKWCLVVTTPDEVILLALKSATNDPMNGVIDNALPHREGALEIIPTRYSVPTDSVKMLSVCGTTDGRIFLGGEDGCLYEMDYEGLNPREQSSNALAASTSLDDRLDMFYDGGKDTPTVLKDDYDNGNWFVSGGKRVLTSVVFGSGSQDYRPKKCRKLNHSNGVSSLASAVVPDFVIKATSYILGGGKSSSGGGGIKQMVVDEERSCLYTLGLKGWVCAFDISSKDRDNKATLAAVMNTPDTARAYLDAVARQIMNPSSSHLPTMGRILFPGSGSAAQAGVGGMDGARNILKSFEQSKVVLAPVSLHVVPRRESSRITLVAVTRGGLRYYISSLAPQILSGNASEKTMPLTPSGGKLALCHIRAPPPMTEEGRTQDISSSLESDDGIPVGGFFPKSASSANKMPYVDAGFYSMGAMVLAMKKPSKSTRSQSTSDAEAGDVVISTAPDCVLRKGDKAPGGVSETLSIAMNTAYGKTSPDDAPVLPGGLIFDIAQTSAAQSDLFTLMLNSETPADRDLGHALGPAFIPSRRAMSKKSSAEWNTQNGLANGVVATQTRSLGSTAFAVAMNMLPNLLLSRPIHHGIRIQKPYQEIATKQPTCTVRYRISKRYGTKGFSLTAAESSTANKTKDSSRIVPSPRLNLRLLRPRTVPLNPLTIQHLLSPSRIVAMNAGGLEYFQFSTVLNALEEALTSAGANVENDETVTSFFTSYGSAEACAMCILLATGQGTFPNHDLRERALLAAVTRASTPKLMPAIQSSNGLVQDSSSSDPLLPQGYIFQSTALLEGVNKVASRLLRPVWHKAFVVVTEGRAVQFRWKSETRETPVKVELLTDEKTLGDIIQPLHALTKLMKNVFREAIDAVPGAMRRQSHMMDIDEEVSTNFITDALMYHNNLRDGRGFGNGQLSPTDAERVAKLTEDRKAHCMYRLVSRSLHLLRLLSLLTRAHSMPGFPEVEWGSLHGLTIAQLVQSRDGQDRLEKLLNALVTLTADSYHGPLTPSAQANDLANQLANQCYLFFSPGSRFAYLGFSLASQALQCQRNSTRRTELAMQAADHFRKAAPYWHSSSLVTGKSLNTKEEESYETIAEAAKNSGSPLAKAVETLVELEHIQTPVRICLTVASNFAGNHITTETTLGLPDGTLSWERDLYHRRKDQGRGATGTGISTSASPSSNTLALETGISSKDAIRTCWALIFYHVSKLLENQETQSLGEDMVSYCAGTNDTSFLHAFFEYMHKSGNTDTLLRVDSLALENWLKDEMKDIDLLHKYYLQQERFYKAGVVSSDYAYSAEIPLEERIVLLSRASSAYEKVLEDPTTAWRESGKAHEFSLDAFIAMVRNNLTVIKDKHDVARLQSQVLQAVSTSDPDAKDEIKELSTKLLDVSTLFNDFAGPRGFYSICLLIMNCCQQNDSAAIKDLWRKVFCEQILPCSTRSDSVYGLLRNLQSSYSPTDLVVLLPETASADAPADLFEGGNWARKLEASVVSLGKELFGKGADFTVPVNFLYAELENLRSVYIDSAPVLSSWLHSPEWSMEILRKIGFPYIEVLYACENFADHEENELLGSGNEHRLDQLKGAISFLDKWKTEAWNEPKALQDLLQAYNARGLNDRFKAWEHELDRCSDFEQRDKLREVDSEIQKLMDRNKY